MRFRKTLEIFWRRLPREQISVRAAALTYVSVFSMVPLLAVALLFAQGWHHKTLHPRLQSFIREVLAPGIREQSVAYLDRYIHAASTKAFGIIGLLTLLVSSASLFRNLDGAINEIWRVKRKRPLGAQLAFYVFAAVVGPLVLSLSIAGTASLRQLLIGSSFPLGRFLISFGAIATPIAALALLYWMAPNTPVRFQSAAVGGVAAGILWELAKGGYGTFAAKVIRYNPVYGSLGALPLFLIWVYLSWLVVLFGAHLAYSVQVPISERAKPTPFWIGPHSQVAASIARQMALAEVRKRSPLTERELTQLTGALASEVRAVVKCLRREQLLLPVEGDRYRPSRDLQSLTLAEAVRAVGDLDADFAAATIPQVAENKDVFLPTEESVWRALSRTTWRDLAGDSTRKA